MDINKLKKVRNTLRLQFGGGISKYSKQVGNVTIYSDDGKIWYEDYINKIPTTIHPNIPDQTMSLNDINQFSQNSLNLNYITNLYNKDNLPITEPLSYPAKLSRTAMSLTQQDIQPLSNSINFENNEIPEKIEQFTPKLSKKISYKHELDEIKKLSEANDEESKKQLELANKSAEQTISGIGTMATNIGQIFNAKQQSTDSNLTKGADAVYDGIAGAVEDLGPFGKVLGSSMKTLGALGDVSLSFGGGTDQQTTTDKWMDSSFFSWNIGMLNGFAGKNSDNFSTDLEILAKAGGSYGGSTDAITDAADKAGKKYGLFSSKSRKEANANIARAKAIQNKLGNITNTAEDLRLAAASMGEQAGLAYSLMSDGGYDLRYTYSAKQGGYLIPKNQRGSHIVFSHKIYDNPEIKKYVEPIIQIIDPTGISGYEDVRESYQTVKENPSFKSYTALGFNVLGALPVIGKATKGIELYKAAKNLNKLKKTSERVNRTIDTVPELIPGIREITENILNATSKTITDPIYKLLVNHGVQGAKTKVNLGVDLLNGGNSTNDIIDAVKTYTSLNSESSTPKQQRPGQGIGLPSEKQGGILEWEPQIELNWELENKEELLEWVPEFKQGGSIEDSDIPDKEETTQKNVIPEGALHKNKHHMEHAEGLTKKGIPVIDNDGELQAEVEKEEIVFTLEVTKKLEDFYKIFYSEDSTNKEKEEAAFQAGKLLVYEILENTDDRAGLIESCKLGGTLTWKKPIDVESTPKKDIQKDLIKEAVKEVILELIK